VPDEVIDQSVHSDQANDTMDPEEIKRIEEGWTRGCDPDDAEAVARAAEESRMANLGTTGGVSLPYHPIATGGNDVGEVEQAPEQGEIAGAAAAREAEKVAQSPRVAPATPLATAGRDPEPDAAPDADA
jgi:hypothetical protein